MGGVKRRENGESEGMKREGRSKMAWKERSAVRGDEGGGGVRLARVRKRTKRERERERGI